MDVLGAGAHRVTPTHGALRALADEFGCASGDAGAEPDRDWELYGAVDPQMHARLGALMGPSVPSAASWCLRMGGTFSLNGAGLRAAGPALAWLADGAADRAAAAALNRCAAALDSLPAVVHVFPACHHSFIVDIMGGKMGMALGGCTVVLYMHPSITRHPNGLQQAVAELVAHEYHHHARLGYLVPWEASVVTLADSLVLEGLAERFRLETVGGTPAPWSVAVGEVDVEDGLRRLPPVFASISEEDSFLCMVGDQERIPHWLGYSLGFHLVGSAMRRLGRTAAELTTTPSRDILSAADPEWRAALGL